MNLSGSALPRIFIGGGQDYYGTTAERDRNVIKETAIELFSRAGNSVELVTGGMKGIPQDFALEWYKCGGKNVLCVVSSEHEQQYLSQGLPFKHVVQGATQEARRLAVTQLPGVRVALFVQGGQYSTHEMLLFQEHSVPIVTFWGSGGAAGGTQPYQDVAYKVKPTIDHLLTTDPDYDHVTIANVIVTELMSRLSYTPHL